MLMLLSQISITMTLNFTESICIGGSFHKLKLALLLSSVLSGNELLVEDIKGKLVIGNELQRVNILCISDDVVKLQRLFTYASSVCDKAVLGQQNLDLFGSVTRKHEADTHVHIDGKWNSCIIFVIIILLIVLIKFLNQFSFNFSKTYNTFKP